MKTELPKLSQINASELQHAHQDTVIRAKWRGQDLVLKPASKNVLKNLFMHKEYKAPQ